MSNRMMKYAGIGAVAVVILLVAAFGATQVFAHPGGGANGGESVLPEEYKEAMKEGIASALGMTVEEFEAAKEDGQSLRDIAEAQGITEEELREIKQTVREEVIAQALADGAITQEQADQLLQGKPRRGHGGGGGQPGNGGPPPADGDGA